MTLDEPIQIVDHDPRWFEEYRSDAAEIAIALAPWSPLLEHIGSTSVPGLAAKPIIDILVGLEQWPMAEGVPNALRPLGYEYLGEAGVPGREYFRRRRLHDTNIAVGEYRARLWSDNVLLRDYLRAHPTIAAGYSRAKKVAWFNGARTLVAYSEAKAAEMTALLERARRWSDRMATGRGRSSDDFRRPGSPATIRRAEPGDAAALARLAERTFRDAFAAGNDPVDMQRHCSAKFGSEIQLREIEDAGLVTLLSEKEGELIGFAQVRLHSAIECVSAQRPSELHRLYVSRQWHGRGVAHELMNEVLATVRRIASDRIWLGVWDHNGRALAFYRKFGFDVVGDHVFQLGADLQRDLVMVLEVDQPPAGR